MICWKASILSSVRSKSKTIKLTEIKPSCEKCSNSYCLPRRRRRFGCGQHIYDFVHFPDCPSSPPIFFERRIVFDGPRTRWLCGIHNWTRDWLHRRSWQSLVQAVVLAVPPVNPLSNNFLKKIKNPKKNIKLSKTKQKNVQVKVSCDSVNVRKESFANANSLRNFSSKSRARPSGGSDASSRWLKQFFLLPNWQQNLGIFSLRYRRRNFSIVYYKKYTVKYIIENT